MPHFVFLPTDAAVWLTALLLVYGVFYAAKHPGAAARWKSIFARPVPQGAAAVLLFFFAAAMLDSVHFRPLEESLPGRPSVYAPAPVSLLDWTAGRLIAGTERSYSAPFAYREADKTADPETGVRRFARLQHVAAAAVSPRSRNADILKRTAAGVLLWALLCGAAAAAEAFCRKKQNAANISGRSRSVFRKYSGAVLISAVFLLIACVLFFTWGSYHPFGTDKTGNDVLWQSVKSLRTAFALGILATVSMLPFAIFFGIAAGFFKGLTDDIVQYLYTTISSVPSVLLIAASSLLIQVFIAQHPELLPTALERADARLFAIALIIGMTGWAGLARLLRAETLKLSGMDFVTAARASGTPPLRIMRRHIFPNVTHIVLIVAVIGFSDIVLYEAVLSYIGVGVDPSMNSFGSMINAAKNEMARTPPVWWNLAASFLFMVTLVLAANLFASAVRDAFDPRQSGGSR